MFDNEPNLVRVATIVLRTLHIRSLHLHQEVYRSALDARFTGAQPGEVEPHVVVLRSSGLAGQTRERRVHRPAYGELSVSGVLELNSNIAGVEQEVATDTVPEFYTRT